MDYYAIGLGITVITMIISISICACCCRINACAIKKDENRQLLNTNSYKEIIVSV